MRMTGQATTRSGVGVDPQIIDDGNVQVTAWGEGNAQCKPVWLSTSDHVAVQCFAGNGAPMDTYFTVLYHS